ncbi:hypothetical protein OCU04_008009 [Sclerotinia nivalis]|uniref:Uncharacterized protein n=1 Tax=Sclerotinia nivalis TaxID=352851 RepID=A0A9X0DJ73_9HELO|nr:hypothetical protein OCU04_008009 [Sclerotinia nivalis]
MDSVPTRNHRRLFARRNGFTLEQSHKSLLFCATVRNAGAVASDSDRRIIISESKSKRNTNIKRHSKLGKQPDSEKTSKRGIPSSWWRVYIASLKISAAKINSFLQKQLSIYLYTYSYMNIQLCTFCSIETFVSCDYIEPALHFGGFDKILEFQDILNLIRIPPNSRIHDHHTYEMKLDIINMLEETLVSTISHLHTKHISYPIKNTEQPFFVYTRSLRKSNTEKATLRLLLGYNEHASWMSDNLSATWRSDEIEHAGSLFHLPKLLIKLRDSPNKISLDTRDNRILTKYLKFEQRYGYHFDLCSEKIASMTFELTRCISYHYALRKEGTKACAIFDVFFPKCDSSLVPLPPLSSRHLPLDICAFYRKVLRQGRGVGNDTNNSNVSQYSSILTEVDNANGDKNDTKNTPNRTIIHEENKDRQEGFNKVPLDNNLFKTDFQHLKGEQDDEDSMVAISNKSLAHLIYICAEASMIYLSDEEDIRQWWFLALKLYDAFLSEPLLKSRSDRICAGRAYGYREMMMENR